MRCSNQLKKLLRIIQQLPELVLIFTERGCRELCRHARIFQPGVGRHEANFVGTDPLHAGERGFQLLGEFRRLGFTDRERTREATQLFLRDGWEKLHAGETRGRKQLGELLFGGRPLERHAIQEQLRAGSTEQQSCVGPERNGCAKLTESGLQVFRRARVLETVQAGKLEEDVQTPDECPARRRFWIRLHPSPHASPMGLPN